MEPSMSSTDNNKPRRRLTGAEWLLGFPRPAVASSEAAGATPEARPSPERKSKRRVSPPHW
jgi:hypothetical protein